MPYDRDSYLAGLVAGRAMWRPMPKPSFMDYGGWTASSAFAVFEAGTTLAAYEGSSRSPFKKSRNGWAICCVITGSRASGYVWTGPLLISPERDNALYDNPLGRELAEFGTVVYDGITWYGNHMYWNNSRYGGGSQTPETEFPVLDASDTAAFPSVEAEMLAVLALAGARSTE